MAKSSKELVGEERALKPAMRDLIMTFDAKDRRDEEAAKSSDQKSKERRRRSDDFLPVTREEV
jgi:hypothetical protein